MKAKLELWRNRSAKTVTRGNRGRGVPDAPAALGSETRKEPANCSTWPAFQARHLSTEKRYELAVDGDYWVDEKQKQATLTEAGHERVEEMFV